MAARDDEVRISHGRLNLAVAYRIALLDTAATVVWISGGAILAGVLMVFAIAYAIAWGFDSLHPTR